MAYDVHATLQRLTSIQSRQEFFELCKFLAKPGDDDDPITCRQERYTRYTHVANAIRENSTVSDHLKNILILPALKEELQLLFYIAEHSLAIAQALVETNKGLLEMMGGLWLSNNFPETNLGTESSNELTDDEGRFDFGVDNLALLSRISPTFTNVFIQQNERYFYDHYFKEFFYQEDFDEPNAALFPKHEFDPSVVEFIIEVIKKYKKEEENDLESDFGHPVNMFQGQAAASDEMPVNERLGGDIGFLPPNKGAL